MAKPVSFPKSILVQVVEDGDDTYLAAAANPTDLPDDGSGKTARYVLVGTGRVEYSAPRYVEDAKA